MLKSFRIALLAIAPTVLLSQVAFTAEPLTAPISIADDAVCYMVTSDGRTLNLTALCGTLNRGPSAQSGTAAQQPVYTRPPGNLGGLDIFGRGPGAPPCFGLDDNGRPCPSSRS